MKKLALLATLVAATAVGAVLVSGAVAGTPNPIAQSTGFACGVFDENGNIFITFQSSDTLFQNKEQLHCVGQSPSGGNGTVVTQSGFGCNLVFTGFSANAQNFSRVSKSGESQLSCFQYPLGDSPSASVSGAAGAAG
jgi:hypothetical protein